MTASSSSSPAGFLSPHLILASSTVTEALLALAFTQLPFSSTVEMVEKKTRSREEGGNADDDDDDDGDGDGDAELVVKSVDAPFLIFKSAISESSGQKDKDKNKESSSKSGIGSASQVFAVQSLFDPSDR